MSYLVLVLGTFLTLCGALAVNAGYSIIQVERGWAGVIAGSMAFSCGIVTIALGLILYRLTQLQAYLKSAKALPPPPRELPFRTAEAPRRAPSPAFAPESSHDSSMEEASPPPILAVPSARSWPPRPIRSNLTAARNFLKSRGTGLPTARGTPETEYSSLNSPSLSREALKKARTPVELPFEPDFTPPAGEREAARPEDLPETRREAGLAQETSQERAGRAAGEPGLFDEDMKAPPAQAGFPGHAQQPWRVRAVTGTGFSLAGRKRLD